MKNRLSFTADARGSIAVMTAVGIAMLIALTALALNVARAYQLQARMSQAADIASLAGAVSYSKDQNVGEAKKHGKRYYEANVPLQYASISMGDIAVDTGTGEVTVDAYNKMPVYLSDVSTMGVRTTATAVAVLDGDFSGSIQEIALVLDVTTSMSENGKMDSMKATAKNFLDTVFESNSALTVSIVPFNHTVKFDTTHPYENWLKQDVYSRFLAASALNPDPATYEAWNGCVVNNLPPNDTNDATYETAGLIPYNVQQYQINRYYSIVDSQLAYNSRKASSLLHYVDENSGTTSTYGNTEIDSIAKQKNITCYMPHVIPLTNDLQALKSHIDTISSSGYGWPTHGQSGTIGSFGIMWGWRTISPKWSGKWPSTGAALPSSSAETGKAIVFLTDGLGEMPASTQADGTLGFGYGAYGYPPIAWSQIDLYNWKKYGINATTIAQGDIALDGKLKQTCTNIKNNDNITVYVVGYDVVDTPSEAARANDVLAHCASAEENFFLPENSAALAEAFTAISSSIKSFSKPVRLVR